MSDTTHTTNEKYPNVTERQIEIVSKYGELLNNTGGNDPLDLLDQLADPKRKNLMSTNIVVFLLATAVSSQVTLLSQLERDGLLKPQGEQS